MRPSTFLTVIVYLNLFQSESESAFAEHTLQSPADPVLSEVARVEKELSASVGLFVHDLESGEVITHAADDRFPLNSTFKVFACAAVLARVEDGFGTLEDSVELGEQKLITWSPAVERMLKDGRERASLDDLCAAMLSVSDNTAANLVLEQIGGPEGFSAYMRSIGDTVTRLDRWEPELNAGLPDDPRDTTTPRAIGASLEKVLLGNALAPSSRETLKGWLAGHSVADDLFRAVLPTGWSIYDRTGAGDNGTRGIVAVIHRPHQQPLVAAMYLRDAQVSVAERSAAIARVGHAIFARSAPQ